ncbi:MAG: DUF2784 domain-containing protein [Planctomycetes bacterium]|nr:DUF2784 domain-containing protein [Planctomycetota bacterium]
MTYDFLANLVVAVHLLYVGFVLFGLVTIYVGLAFGWLWIRNPWFRWLHLLMISIVALEAIFGITCPLTTWEDRLRQLAGEQVEQGAFVGRLLHNLMFFQAPPWVFTVSYITFALLVLGTLWLVPPRPWRRPSPLKQAAEVPGEKR